MWDCLSAIVWKCNDLWVWVVCSWLSAERLYFSSVILKVSLHFFQREQEMRVGELGPRGAINMGGMGIIV